MQAPGDMSEGRLVGGHHSPGGRRAFRLILSSLAVAMLVNLLPGVAVAGPLPVSLAGEDLQFASGTGTGSATCTSTDTGGPGFRGSGSETFNGGGPASGLYPGTFTAQGTISVSADATTFDVNETFTITSSAGTWTGVKQGTAIPIPHTADGYPINVICQNPTNELGLVVPSLAFTSQVVPWSATIQTATGTYSDSGHGTLLEYTGLFGASDGSTGVIIYHPEFDEQFNSSNGVTTALATPTLTTQVMACCFSGDGSRFQPTASTTAGGGIADTANLVGGNAPTGTITFGLFGPDNSNCSGTAVFTSTPTVAGNGSYSSDPYTAVVAGTYRWVASYSGDANNNPATTACNDVNETSFVIACPLSLSGPSPCGEQFASTTTPFPPGFGGSATVTSKTCNADGSGSLSFTADGTATGPYPGIFHEVGTIVLAPTAANGNVYVTSADATFTITSPIGNVSGTKSFNTSANPGDSAGRCSFEPTDIDPGRFLNFQSQQQQTYQATITTAHGQFTDSGTGGSTFNTSFQGVNLSPQFVNAFTEVFTVSTGPIDSSSDLALIDVPVNITVPATAPSGAVVTYTPPTAVDEAGEGPAPTVNCNPASGSTFAIGTTTVTCTASDADDTPSTVSATFTVTVTPLPDTDLALANLPTDITVPATSSTGAVVTYTAPTAVDEGGETSTVTCTPASGSTFAVGTTTVKCSATDADDTPSTVSATFTVTVTPLPDTDLALVNLPTDITVPATSSAGAVVTYTTPTAVDEAGETATVSCTAASGSTFAIGTTTVTCTATSADDTPSTVSATFTVTVNDTDLALIAPANITVPATSPAGAVVTYTTPTAVDEAGETATVSCTPASGSTFAIGTTTVTCTATSADDTPSTVSATFTVTVNDTDLALIAPANITVPATSPAGAVVTYTTPTAVDEAGETATVSCTPASGATFPIGTTTVTCTATSADDNPSTVTASFTVTVTPLPLDTDLTLIGMPGNITVPATSSAGAVVTYSAPTAGDEAGDSPVATVSCTPISGSTFPIGTTTVTCTATSADDNPSTVSATFTVTVVASPAGISSVVGQLLAAGCIDNAGIANALTAKLAAAQSAINAGNLKTAINILSAFIDQVQAQSAKHILASCTLAGVTFNPAAVLIADARSIIESLAVTATPNVITGSVVTATGSGISGATLSLVDRVSGKTLATATTDVTGFYFFPTTGLLSAGGTYSVSVTGFPAGFTSSSLAAQTFIWAGSPISFGNFTISP
jgi:hypothetical protein